MAMTDFPEYLWATEEEHANNNDTMSDFLDHELTDDYEVVFVDGTYAEIRDEHNFYWGCHASGDGDFFRHKITFDAIGFRVN